MHHADTHTGKTRTVADAVGTASGPVWVYDPTTSDHCASCGPLGDRDSWGTSSESAATIKHGGRGLARRHLTSGRAPHTQSVGPALTTTGGRS